MKALSVIGTSNSGKTTTVEAILKELKSRGYSTGSVKEIHFKEFRIDTPGSDTDRHLKAGAAVVTARGLRETDILFNHSLPIEDIIRFYTQDYLILEGVRDAQVPKIITAHNVQEVEERLDDSVFAIAGVISNGMDEYKGLPVFNSLENAGVLVDCIEKIVPEKLPNLPDGMCTLCGMNCEEMLYGIIRGAKHRSDCLLNEQTVQLEIGGRKITLALRDCLDKTIRDLLISEMFCGSFGSLGKDNKE